MDFEPQKINLEQARSLADQGVLLGEYEISNEDYHEGPGYSNSDLKLINKTPAHLKLKQFKITEALAVGAATHALIEGGLVFAEKFHQSEWKTRNSQKFRDEAAEMREIGKTLVTPNEGNKAHAAYSAIKSNHRIFRILSGGVKERAIYWVDERTGILCKVKLDTRYQSAIIELKTCEDAGPIKFRGQVYNYEYFQQGGFYRMGCIAAAKLGINVSPNLVPYRRRMKFKIIAIEKGVNLPAMYDVGERTLKAGEGSAHKALRRLRECLDTNKWPGYPQIWQPLDMDEWAFKKLTPEIIEGSPDEVPDISNPWSED